MADFLIRVIVDPRNATTGARKVRRELDLVDKSAKNTNKSASDLGRTLRQSLGFVSLGVAIASTVRLLASFSQEMSTVRAITNATADEFARLEERALELGTNTRFTATQAAEGMTFLARAGFDANEVLASIEGTLNLAQAGALDLGSAADIASNALQGFRLEVEETARVVDVLALAANSSNTNVQQLGDGLKFVAPIAAGVGVEIEETTAAMSALSNAGLQASLAGTGLRRVISELESATPKTRKLLEELGLSTDDYRVSSVGLTQALENLRKAGVDTGVALEVFGDRGGPAFEVLSASINDVKQFTSALENADGTAARIAATMDDNLNGALLRAKSALEGLILELGEAGITEDLRLLFEALAKTLRLLADNADLLVFSLTTLGGTIAALKLAVLGERALAAASAFIKLRVAVLSGNAVMLGSAAATAQQAAAEVAATEATLANTAATLANLEAQAAKALVVAGSTETVFIQAAVEKQLAIAQSANTAAANAHTAAQARLAVAMKATTVQARILSVINPFAVLTAAAIAGALVTRKLWDQLVEIEEQTNKVVDAGERYALTEFGKVGAEIVNTQRKLERLEELFESGANTSDRIIEKMEEYRATLERLGVTQRLISDGTARTTVEAEKQVVAMEKLEDSVKGVIKAYEQENRLLFLGAQERQIQATLLREIAELEKRTGAEVTPDQRERLEATIRQNAAFQDRARILDEINGPAEKFRSDLEQLNSLLDSNTISQEQFNTFLADMISSLDQADFDNLNLEGLASSIQGIDIEGLRDLLNGLRESTEDRGGGPKLSDELQLQLDLYNSIRGPQQQFAATQQALGALLDANAISAEEYAIALNQAALATSQISSSASAGLESGLARIENQIIDTAGAVETTLVNAFSSAQDAFVDFVTTGEINFSQFVDSILADVAKLAFNQGIKALFGGGGEGGALFDLFGGAKQGGGPVTPDKTFLVGEEGPELFTPPSAGSIIPAGETAAALSSVTAAAPIVNVAPPSINITNVSDPSEIPAGIESATGEQAVMNVIRRNRRSVRSSL